VILPAPAPAAPAVPLPPASVSASSTFVSKPATVQSANRKIAVAKYAYQAVHPDELSFAVG
jgi:hypothetical protein